MGPAIFVVNTFTLHGLRKAANCISLHPPRTIDTIRAGGFLSQREVVLVQREMETEDSFVSGLGYVIRGSVYGFMATGASSPYGFLLSGSVPGL